jgi:hypothetical protein
MRHRAGITLTVISSFMLSACSSMVTAWKNDPLQAYTIERPTIYAMTGDRRTAVMMLPGQGQRFCAESLPDAAAAFSAASEANAGVKDQVTGAFKDSTTAALLQTFQRTEIAEVYRQMGWNLCLAWAQQAIDTPQYHALLKEYLTGGIDVIKTRASQPAAAAAGAAAAKPADPPKPGTIDLGDGVKLQPATTTSGYCIKAASGYTGNGKPNKPSVTNDLPLCA